MLSKNMALNAGLELLGHPLMLKWRKIWVETRLVAGILGSFAILLSGILLVRKVLRCC